MARIIRKQSCGCENKNVTVTQNINNPCTCSNKLKLGILEENSLTEKEVVITNNTELITLDTDIFEVIDVDREDKCKRGHAHIQASERFQEIFKIFLKGDFIKDIESLEDFIVIKNKDDKKPRIKTIEIDEDRFSLFLQKIFEREDFILFLKRYLESETFIEFFKELFRSETFIEFFKELFESVVFENFFRELILKIISSPTFNICELVKHCIPSPTYTSNITLSRDFNVVCPPGMRPTINPIRISSPVQTFESRVSQEDADNKAREFANNWLDQNGQRVANEQKVCEQIPVTTYRSSKVQSRDFNVSCDTGYAPQVNPIRITSPVFTETSTISQEDADNKANRAAEEWLNTNGQNQANQQKVCVKLDSKPTTLSDIVLERDNRVNIPLTANDFNGKWRDVDNTPLEAIKIMGDVSKLKLNGVPQSGTEFIINTPTNFTVEYSATDTNELSQTEYTFQVKSGGVWSD